MPGPLFSASRASRRLRWPPEPSPAASLGDVGSGCHPRLAPALPAAPRSPPVTSAPRTTTRPLERAVDAHTAGRGALSVDASASLLGRCSVPRRGGAAEYGSMPKRVTTDEMRALRDGEAPRMFRLAGEVQAIRVTAWLLACRGMRPSTIQDNDSYSRVVDPRDVTNKPLFMNVGM